MARSAGRRRFLKLAGASVAACASTVAKVKAAGLDLCAGGVIAAMA